MIFLSWLVSPILAAIATSILYVGVRTLVLRRKRSFDLACLAIPFLVGLTFFCIVVFIIQTGESCADVHGPLPALHQHWHTGTLSRHTCSEMEPPSSAYSPQGRGQV